MTKRLWNRGAAAAPGDNLATSLRSGIIDVQDDYDWEGDQPLHPPMGEPRIIYEMHVRGFTQSPSAQVQHPGKFAGVIEKIPYLKALGVTAVELLPVHEFDETDVLREYNGTPLANYWGYSTMGFFAPHSAYCTSPQRCAHVREFRDMVKALHQAGIQVFLDVVFNHTDEGNHNGPIYCYKGLDNSNYYYLVPGDGQFYFDYTGCGNTFQCNHPIGRKLIVESLEYWVDAMHVDGFRFDEATVLTRGEDGSVLTDPPVIWDIELSDTLSDSRIIAEAWDAYGAYEVGHYPGYRWSEWNGAYRDTIRKFVKGDPGLVGAVATRMAGSPDLYQSRGHLPINSINFITCHDGFTLYDLVSYNEKHNEANGEDNRDGNNDNSSWNCGAEGDTTDPAILALRARQIKNFGAILMLSRGLPMFVMGDEVERTQRGNNNAYCQDNAVSWFDWTLPQANAGLLRFWTRLIAFRKAHPTLYLPEFYTGLKDARGVADVTWHGTKLNQPGWDDPNARALAFTLGGLDGSEDLHVMMNMYWEPLDFDIMPIPGRRWYRSVDTSQSSPLDIAEAGQEPSVGGNTYTVAGRSVVILVARA